MSLKAIGSVFLAHSWFYRIEPSDAAGLQGTVPLSLKDIDSVFLDLLISLLVGSTELNLPMPKGSQEPFLCP